MDLSRIDLNLLLVLHRLLQERHVSRSAAALGLTQPAVSNALRRLRSLLGDDLLVRTAGGMRPTPYAERLAGPLAQALGALEGALSTREQFDPAASERRFTLALSDVGEIYFLPVLMPALATEAPGVTLRVLLVHTFAIGLGAGFYETEYGRAKHNHPESKGSPEASSTSGGTSVRSQSRSSNRPILCVL